MALKTVETKIVQLRPTNQPTSQSVKTNCE